LWYERKDRHDGTYHDGLRRLFKENDINIASETRKELVDSQTAERTVLHRKWSHNLQEV
jgi:hypothetical protein